MRERDRRDDVPDVTEDASGADAGGGEERRKAPAVGRTTTPGGGGREALRASPMMAHLLDALEGGDDIAHYGRLTFTMVARHFLPADELEDLVAGQPGQNPARARALLLQVTQKNYSPPKRERILQWQAQQDFPICPTPDDPASCNVYRELQFPDDVYQEIEEFWEEQAEGEDA
ncbi:MAG: hypothetical protein ABR599_11770 [Gemmatimonadota bacterium]